MLGEISAARGGVWRFGKKVIEEVFQWVEEVWISAGGVRRAGMNVIEEVH